MATPSQSPSQNTSRNSPDEALDMPHASLYDQYLEDLSRMRYRCCLYTDDSKYLHLKFRSPSETQTVYPIASLAPLLEG